MVVFDSSRIAEATRTAARYAIVNNPACDIFGRGTGSTAACSSDEAMICPDAVPVTLTIDDCAFPATTTECKMVAEMNQMVGRDILAGSGKVKVTYTCSSTGDTEALPGFVPVVTIEAIDIKQPMLLSSILGIGLETDCSPFAPPCITLPGFETSRTGEDMYNVTP